MQDSCHRLVFKDTCYPRFSNTHAFSKASSLCFPKISLNGFTHQHPPKEERKMFGLEHTCAPFAFGNLIWKEQICALTEFTDKPLRLTELQGQQKSWFTFNLRKNYLGMSAGIFLTLAAARTLRALASPYLATIHMGGGAFQNIFKKGQ